MSDTGVVRRWGNSLAIVIPAEIAKNRQLKEGQEVLFNIVPRPDLSKLFGIAKDSTMSAQEFKDGARAGWARN